MYNIYSVFSDLGRIFQPYLFTCNGGNTARYKKNLWDARVACPAGTLRISDWTLQWFRVNEPVRRRGTWMFRWKLGSMVSKWWIITTYSINEEYWGYNPLTNLLLTSWDIQVGSSKMTPGLCGVFGSL